MGKRKHQSSSVEQVSPVVIKRASSRLTRSKKLKSTAKSASPVLGKVSVSRVSDASVAGSTSKTRINPIKSTRRRISDVQRLIELDCQTPVRSRHGRSSHVQFNSPHSESEPEIIWDDKSPNAVQPRKLGKAGKRNAVQDISDIINCVPEVIVDTSNKKPSLLSLWMTRDSPSPKEPLKSSQESNGPHKKKVVGKKKARKSRLSALTHELEKVLNAIEPEEGDLEEEEETTHEVKTDSSVSETATSTSIINADVSPPTLCAQASTHKNALFEGRHSPPTLYTQTKPTEVPGLPKPIPLPALGLSPDAKCQRSDVKVQRSDFMCKNDLNIAKQEKQPFKEDICKGSSSDDSPPGSQTKWEAIGNESAEDLWGDDDMFEDDGILMETIEVEIASSQQVPSSTPVRKLKKKQIPKGSENDSNGVKGSGFKKPQSSDDVSALISASSDAKKHTKTFVAAPCVIPKQSSTSRSNPTFSKPNQTSQQKFVPHRTETKSGFQPFKPITSIGSTDSQTIYSGSKTNASGCANYSLRSGNRTPAPNQSYNKYPVTTASTTNKSNLLSSNTAATIASCVTRTSPPNITRVVYSTSSTSAVTNTSFATRSQTGKFVPFKPESQSKSKSEAPVTTNSGVLPSVSQNCRNTANPTNANNVPSFQKHMPEGSSHPVQKTGPSQQHKSANPTNANNVPSFQKHMPEGSSHPVQKTGPSQQHKSKIFEPYGKQTSSSLTISAANEPQAGNRPHSQTLNTAANNTAKVYVPYSKANRLSATQRQYPPSSASASNSNKTTTMTHSHSIQTTTMTYGQSNQTDVTQVKSTKPMSLSQIKPYNDGAHHEIGDIKSKTFVPFKKPQTSDQSKCNTPAVPNQSFQFKQSSQSSSQYTPSIPSSQNMNKSVVFGKIPTKSSSPSIVATSKTFVSHNSVNTSGNTNNLPTASVTSTKPHTFVRANTSQSAMPKRARFSSVTTRAQNCTMPNKGSSISGSQSCIMQTKSSSIAVTNKFQPSTNTGYGQSNMNKNPAAKCSNNNVKTFSSSKDESKPSGGLSVVGTTDSSIRRRSTGAGPDSISSGVDGGQFDDSLPDEMLMSVMDGSWDEF